LGASEAGSDGEASPSRPRAPTPRSAQGIVGRDSISSSVSLETIPISPKPRVIRDVMQSVSVRPQSASASSSSSALRRFHLQKARAALQRAELDGVQP
jgi:hypothetical protein